MTDKEIEKRIDQIKTTDDMGKLYFYCAYIVDLSTVKSCIRLHNTRL